MATVHVALCTATGKGKAGTPMPVPDSVPIAADTITTSVTSAQASITAVKNPNRSDFWTVTVSGGNVLVLFGTNPTAVADAGFYLVDGTTRDFAVSANNEKFAVKDA